MRSVSAVLIAAVAVLLQAAPAAAQETERTGPPPPAAAVSDADPAPLTRDERRARFDAIRALVDTDPGRALERMIALAETGDARAQQEVGTFYRRGIGTPVDLPLARLWYERAIAGGRPYALAPLARVETAQGNGAAAHDLLQRAIAADMPGALRQLGLAHVDRQLGRHSDPQQGLRVLMDLIDGGDRAAARPLLLRFVWGRLPLPAPERLVTQVEAAGLRGDGRSAEAALLYLTKAERYAPGSRSRRKALIGIEGIRERTLASERMLLAADAVPQSFFHEADRIIALTPRAHFPRAALTAYRVSPNAYVRILQRELRILGYYHGGVNGWLTAATITAHHRFCQEAGILDQCREGPQRTETIRAVTEALAGGAPVVRK